MLATCCYFPRTMQASASNQPDSDYRTCDACGARVRRTEVHKNRYRQYICRDCRASGVHAVGRHRVRRVGHRWIQRMPVALVTFLAVILVLVFVPLVFMLLAQLHTYSNAGMVGDLKDLVRSINQWAH